jgi:hypothetical protein
MPITRSELVYFAAGVAVGAAARSAFPVLKEKFGPLIAGTMAGAGTAFNESYAEIAKRVAEKVETVQDAMAEMKHGAADVGKPEGSSAA